MVCGTLWHDKNNYGPLSMHYWLCGIILIFLYLSLQYVKSCSVNFTVRNYTVEIDNEEALRVESLSEAESLTEQGKIRLRLNSTDLEAVGIGLDSSHQLAIRVCHDLLCKTSTPQTFCKCFPSNCSLKAGSHAI